MKKIKLQKKRKRKPRKKVRARARAFLEHCIDYDGLLQLEADNSVPNYGFDLQNHGITKDEWRWAKKLALANWWEEARWINDGKS